MERHLHFRFPENSDFRTVRKNVRDSTLTGIAERCGLIIVARVVAIIYFYLSEFMVVALHALPVYQFRCCVLSVGISRQQLSVAANSG